MLYLIGLGLTWKDISQRALEAINECSEVYLESYTSLADFSIMNLHRLLGKEIISLDRKSVEEKRPFFKNARASNIALLVYGDPLSATTHTEILLEARKRKIRAQVIHAPSVLTAIAETGLQPYKFGKIASIPMPEEGFKPESFFNILEQNQSIGAHTLFLLDLKPDMKKFLTVPQAIQLLLKVAKKRKSKLFMESTLCIGCARLGTPKQLIKSGAAKQLSQTDFGKPPFCLIVPADLHFAEEAALAKGLYIS